MSVNILNEHLIAVFVSKFPSHSILPLITSIDWNIARIPDVLRSIPSMFLNSISFTSTPYRLLQISNNSSFPSCFLFSINFSNRNFARFRILSGDGGFIFAIRVVFYGCCCCCSCFCSFFRCLDSVTYAIFFNDLSSSSITFWKSYSS